MYLGRFIDDTLKHLGKQNTHALVGMTVPLHQSCIPSCDHQSLLLIDHTHTISQEAASSLRQLRKEMQLLTDKLGNIVNGDSFIPVIHLPKYDVSFFFYCTHNKASIISLDPLLYPHAATRYGNVASHIMHRFMVSDTSLEAIRAAFDKCVYSAAVAATWSETGDVLQLDVVEVRLWCGVLYVRMWCLFVIITPP